MILSTGTILTLAYLPEQVSYFNVAPVVGGDDSVSFDGDIFQLSVYTIHRQGLPIHREEMKIRHFLHKLNIRKNLTTRQTGRTWSSLSAEKMIYPSWDMVSEVIAVWPWLVGDRVRMKTPFRTVWMLQIPLTLADTAMSSSVLIATFKENKF